MRHSSDQRQFKSSQGQRANQILPVASDGLKGAVVSAERDVESDDGLASLDQVEVLLLNAGLLGGIVEEKLDLLEETRLVVLVKLGAELLLSSGELTKHH